MAAAAPPAPAQGKRIVLACSVTEDDTVGSFAAVREDNPTGVAASGDGAKDLQRFAAVAQDRKWAVVSLGGLDAMKRAYDELGKSSKELQALGAAHTDAAYDFIVDNGFPLLWPSAFPGLPAPESAVEAARMICEWLKKAEATGVVSREAMSGKTVHWPLIVYDEVTGLPRFRTVKEAKEHLKACPPDQSWMLAGTAPDVNAEAAWLP